MDGWNTSFLLGWTIFRGYVSFRECNDQATSCFFLKIPFDGGDDGGGFVSESPGNMA